MRSLWGVAVGSVIDGNFKGLATLNTTARTARRSPICGRAIASAFSALSMTRWPARPRPCPAGAGPCRRRTTPPPLARATTPTRRFGTLVPGRLRHRPTPIARLRAAAATRRPSQRNAPPSTALDTTLRLERETGFRTRTYRLLRPLRPLKTCDARARRGEFWSGLCTLPIVCPRRDAASSAFSSECARAHTNYRPSRAVAAPHAYPIVAPTFARAPAFFEDRATENERRTGRGVV